jgi:very-short-patch-repair endonuclease
MSDEHAYQQCEEAFGGTLRSLTPQRISESPVQPQSPIERQFLIGLMSFGLQLPLYDFGDSFSRFVSRDGAFPVVRVTLQAPVEGYKADFLLEVTHKGKTLGRVVIECDGHQFHKRTKEQAAHDRARDRKMTLAGYKVMRFTGSEIYRNLTQCVDDAHWAAWHCYTGGADQ